LLPFLWSLFIIQPALANTLFVQLDNKLLELNRQIAEIQKKSDSEANAIKEKINQITVESDEQKSSDVFTSVQNSAKTGKVEPVVAKNTHDNYQPEFLNHNDDIIVNKWYPYLHLTPKAGEDRQLGRIIFMYPLSQSSESMFFTDIRATVDNDNAIEGNVGLGYRQIMTGDNGSDDWIWGIYGFYDRLRSPYNNQFDQGTFGAELLMPNFEIRGNLYIPDNASYVVGRNTISCISLSGTTVMERTLSLEAYERSLQGFDCEVGYGFNITKKDQLWIHGGYFSFNNSDTPDIAGPRLRLQYEWNDAFGLSDSTLAFGVEIQHDDVRETQTFAGVNWSIPFGSHQKSRKVSKRWRSIESRMMRPIIRDIDVVTYTDNINESPGTKEGPEIVSNCDTPLIDPATGQKVDIYFVNANGSTTGTGTQDAPMTIVQAENTSGTSDVIFLLNDSGNIDVSGTSGGTLTLKPFQQLLSVGDNTSKNVSLPKGHTLAVSSTAGRPTLTRPSGANVVTLLWNNTLDGITISGGDNGVYGLNVNNPTIRDVVIHSTRNDAIYLDNSSGTVTISGSVIRDNFTNGIYLRNTAGGSFTASISDNVISNNGGIGFYGLNTNASTFTGNFHNNTISENSNQGVYIYNSNSSVATVDVIDNLITRNTNEGLRIYNYTGSTLTATVHDNLFSENQDDNIYCYNSASIFNLLLNSNDITNSVSDAGVHIGSVSAGGIFSANITDNRITSNIDQGLYLYNSGSSFSLTARDNTITGNQAGGIDYDTDAGATNLTIKNNIIRNNSGGITTDDIGISIDQDTDISSTLSLELRNNLIEYNGYTGLRLDNMDGTFNASIRSNSIVNNALDGVYIVNQTTGIFTSTLFNNTITTNAVRGVWLYNNTGTLNTILENNTIAMNISDGLELDNINGGTFDYDFGGGTLASVGLNSIFANSSGVDINNDTGVSIKAENNWWGTAPPNPARFSGTVDFNPYLTSDPN
jgi:hypothetical protein